MKTGFLQWYEVCMEIGVYLWIYAGKKTAKKGRWEGSIFKANEKMADGTVCPFCW